jgi:hypothetical protein
VELTLGGSVTHNELLIKFCGYKGSQCPMHIFNPYNKELKRPNVMATPRASTLLAPTPRHCLPKRNGRIRVPAAVDHKHHYTFQYTQGISSILPPPNFSMWQNPEKNRVLKKIRVLSKFWTLHFFGGCKSWT